MGRSRRTASRGRWFDRRLGMLGIVLGSLLLLGSSLALAAAGGGSTTRSGGPPSAGTGTRTPHGDGSGHRRSPKPTHKPKPTHQPAPKPTRPPAGRTHLVARVIDGDTVELGNGQDVRLVGIDTPERGQCGYDAATANMVRLVQGKAVRLTISDEDRDRYGRLLRYVDVGGVDAGLAQIRGGFAVARYDSRDGYGFHPREPRYIRADRSSKPVGCPAPAAVQPSAQPAGCVAGYSPCLPVGPDLDCADIGRAVTVTGSDPYRLDADGDGVGCDGY